MNCQNCGAELAPGVAFCRECGAKVIQKKRFCRECGAPLADGVKFCSECGARTELIIDADSASNTVSTGSAPENISSNPEPENVVENLTAKVTESIPVMSEKVTEFSDKMSKKISSFSETVSEKTASLGKASTLKNATPPKANKKKFIGIGVAALILIILLASLGGKGTSSNSGSKTSGDSTVTESKIEMISVADMDYPTAVKALNDAGFSNIVSNVGSDTDEALWVVTGQSESAGEKVLPDTKIELVCAMKCNLYLDLTSEGNLFFSTYDISISLDGKEIGTVANGKEFTYLVEVLSGDHELVFYKTGNTSPKGTKKLSVSGNMTYTCTLSHDSSSISLKNETTESNVAKATLEATDVTGMVLSDAMAILDNIGFSNLREEPYGSIWDKDNWIVVSQGISAGTIADKNEYFQLDCISLGDYFSQTYVGKNVAEIQALADERGFVIRFEDASGKDLNSTISNLDDAAKTDWVAASARQYGGAVKTAVVKMEYKGIVPETIVQETTESKEETTQQPAVSTSVSYSTNSKDTVKNGKTGVYSYKSHGGSYDIYYIIDFDEGYVYYFCDGNGDTTCDRIKIDSGTLNDVVIITYHDGGVTWQEGLHFKRARQPDHLIVEDHNRYEYDFYTTDLSLALAKRDSKTIHDY